MPVYIVYELKLTRDYWKMHMHVCSFVYKKSNTR